MPCLKKGEESGAAFCWHLFCFWDPQLAQVMEMINQLLCAVKEPLLGDTVTLFTAA